MQRLGLCCLFIDQPIRFRTTTAKYLGTLDSPLLYLAQIVADNTQSLIQAVDFCITHGIGSFRINSGLLPLYTHPQFGYTIDDLPNRDLIEQSLATVKERAESGKLRLAFHPDQFVVLNSPRPEVVESSIAELEYHAMLAERVGADVINIHGGGGYGDKSAALHRFAHSFAKLSAAAQCRLTVENDDKVYTPSELLPLCHDLAIPLVYDVHHHRCLPDTLSIEEATEAALETWSREPLFHVSSPREEENLRLHADFIDPAHVPTAWDTIDPLTVEVEAKAKEVAVMRLLSALKERGWNLEN